MKRPPVYLTMAEVADLLGWTTERTRMFFVANGAAKKIGGRWFISRSSMRDQFQDAYDVLLAKLDEVSQSDQND